MNKSTVYRILIGIMLLAGPMTFAQGHPTATTDDNQEKIKALKVAFFTEQLGLTSSEAAKFWPLYNTYEAEKEQIMSQKRSEVIDKIGADSKYSETEAKSILSRFQDLEHREEALDQKFHTTMASSFSATRTLKLFRAEYEFRKRLLREYRKKHGNDPMP